MEKAHLNYCSIALKFQIKKFRPFEHFFVEKVHQD